VSEKKKQVKAELAVEACDRLPVTLWRRTVWTGMIEHDKGDGDRAER
jgi:hypothetical protein